MPLEYLDGLRNIGAAGALRLGNPRPQLVVAVAQHDIATAARPAAGHRDTGIVIADAAGDFRLAPTARDVGVLGVFSDWPATTTFYASCMGMK